MMVQIFKVQEIWLMSKQDATAKEPYFNDTIITMNRNKNRKQLCLKILTITAQLKFTLILTFSFQHSTTV